MRRTQSLKLYTRIVSNFTLFVRRNLIFCTIQGKCIFFRGKGAVPRLYPILPPRGKSHAGKNQCPAQHRWMPNNMGLPAVKAVANSLFVHFQQLDGDRLGFERLALDDTALLPFFPSFSHFLPTISEEFKPLHEIGQLVFKP